MNVEARIEKFVNMPRAQLEGEARKCFIKYANAVHRKALRSGWSQEKYNSAIVLLPSLIAVADGHYYAMENSFWESIFATGEMVSLLRQEANYILNGDGELSRIIQTQVLFDYLTPGELEAACEFSVCYLLCFGSITPKARRLLDNLFSNV